MARKRIYTVTDLGGGDGGKGGVVHKLCCAMQAHTVLKVGGAQGSHGVRNSRGQAFSFSQFGCGSLEGSRTHITRLMVIEPYGFMHEASLLRYDHGIREILEMVSVDENALCITPFHTFASQLQELGRRDKPKGTIGLGAGVAVVDSQVRPELAIYAKDLTRPDLRDKIAGVRDQKISELAAIVVEDLLPGDQERAREIVRHLNDPKLVDRITDQFRKMGAAVQIVGLEYLKKLLSNDGAVVVESSHGILTDRYYGFHPNVSRLRTMPDAIWEMLKSLDYDGQVFKLGVTRAYAIRHGAGPMVSEDPALGEHLLPGSHKNENRWQGQIRVGPLDFVALRYALNCCGGPKAFDGLAVTWLDQIHANGQWKVCNSYEGASDPDMFTPEGEIKVRHGTDEEQVIRQERLGLALNRCRPVITTHDVCRKEIVRELVEQCKTELCDKLGVPVRMVSLGPTEREKVLL